MVNHRRRLIQGVLIVAFVALAYVLDSDREAGPSERIPASLPGVVGAASEIDNAFQTRRSGFMTETRGIVVATLPDDEDGARHQRFILRLDGGQTLLVAHNVDLAQRVPLSKGDSVEIRGQYEWNERGGLLHWTHHDPDARHPGGWVRLEGHLYE